MVVLNHYCMSSFLESLGPTNRIGGMGNMMHMIIHERRKGAAAHDASNLVLHLRLNSQILVRTISRRTPRRNFPLRTHTNQLRCLLLYLKRANPRGLPHPLATKFPVTRLKCLVHHRPIFNATRVVNILRIDQTG